MTKLQDLIDDIWNRNMDITTLRKRMTEHIKTFYEENKEEVRNGTGKDFQERQEEYIYHKLEKDYGLN